MGPSIFVSIEITATILKKKDTDGEPLVEHILDTAGQKGTGKWTAIEALNEGVPLTLIAEAVFARCLSAMKEERLHAATCYPHEKKAFNGDKEEFLKDLRQALYAAKIVSYAQGFALMRSAAKEHGWTLNHGSIAAVWRGGCIIRSAFLQKITQAYENNPKLENLLLIGYSPSRVARPYQLLTASLNLIVLIIAIVSVMIVRSYYMTMIEDIYPELSSGSILPMLTVGASLFLLVTFINIFVIRRKIIRIWYRKD